MRIGDHDEHDGPPVTSVLDMAADPVRPLRAALRGVATVVAPTSIATSLVFYFGWTRTSTQAAVMGLHDSLLGYSTQDYVLRSIDPMFWPLFVGVLAVLGALAAHLWVVAWAGADVDGRRRLVVGRLVVAVGTAGLLALALGTLGVRVQAPSRPVSLGSPLCVTVGIVLVGYALHLRARFVARPAAAPGPEQAQLRLVGGSLMVLLLFLSLFWSVARYAEVKGVDLAGEIEQGLAQRADVSVYSARRLRLQAPVVETDLGDDGSAYRFRYAGLKLLFRSEHRYFLKPSADSASDVNIVIAEANDLHFEFTRAGAAPAEGTTLPGGRSA